MRLDRSDREISLFCFPAPRMLCQKTFLQQQPVSEWRNLCEPVGLLQLWLPTWIWRTKLRKRWTSRVENDRSSGALMWNGSWRDSVCSFDPRLSLVSVPWDWRQNKRRGNRSGNCQMQKPEHLHLKITGGKSTVCCWVFFQISDNSFLRTDVWVSDERSQTKRGDPTPVVCRVFCFRFNFLWFRWCWIPLRVIAFWLLKTYSTELVFLSSCSPVSVFVPPDPPQLFSVLIYGFQQFETRQRKGNEPFERVLHQKETSVVFSLK